LPKIPARRTIAPISLTADFASEAVTGTRDASTGKGLHASQPASQKHDKWRRLRREIQAEYLRTGYCGHWCGFDR
jgi:hypothetical protein